MRWRKGVRLKLKVQGDRLGQREKIHNKMRLQKMRLSLRNYTSEDNEMTKIMLETQTSEEVAEEKLVHIERRTSGFFSSTSPLGR